MNIPVSKKEQFIYLIFIAAFFIRIIYIFQISQFPLTDYLVRSNTFDQYIYDNKALDIVSGNLIWGNEVFGKEPLYPYFLALIYKIFGYSHFAVYPIQAVLTAIGVILLYKISSQIFNSVVGYITSFILAFYSISIFYDALLLRASLITFLMILLFYFLIKAYKNNSFKLYFLSGVALGLSIITRHNILFLFIALFVLFTVKPFKRAVKNILVFSVAMFLVLLPVLVRNYIVSDYKKIAISTEVNAFWVGNTHTSSGVDVAWSSEYHDLEESSQGSIRKMIYLFFNEIKKRPTEYLKLYIRKFWMFFNGYEAPSNTNYYLYREEFPTILKWPFFNFQLISSLGILGMILALFRERKPYIAYIFIIVLSTSVILFHIQSRFRLPAVPFFIIFSSYSIYFIFDKLKKKEFVKSISIVILSTFFYIILKPDLTYAGFRLNEAMIRPPDRTNLALAYIDSYGRGGDPDNLKDALRQSNLAVKDDGSFFIAYRIRGYIYFMQKNYDGAIDEYKKAIIYRNRNPFLYNELAGVYYEKKDYKKAEIFIKRALHLFPGNSFFEKNLDALSNIIKT